jgi:demethylmenaquinone methyltransferase/2-methoxy-6-polyprenyl-1,4-benzoquinol methylase
MNDRMKDGAYRDEYVQSLFDRMGPTYGVVNMLSSFGFSSLWRRECVRNAEIRGGDCVCDVMAGSGECWPHVPRSAASLLSIDFSVEMVARQRRRQARSPRKVTVLHEKNGKQQARRPTRPWLRSAVCAAPLLKSRL